MGLLDALFGKKTASRARKIQKALTPPPPPKPKAQPLPKVVWSKSAKGNDTTEYEGYRITIFQQDEGWNYVVSEILDEDDLADGLEDSPEFGIGYSTKAAAKRAAFEDNF